MASDHSLFQRSERGVQGAVERLRFAAAIAVMRTALNYFLLPELRNETAKSAGQPPAD
jgi:uncharacterized membrane protein